MGRGAAIVANDVPEHREVLGTAGRFYSRNDPDALAQRLRELVREPAIRVELGAAALERGRSMFSWDHVTDEYEALFRRLVPDKA
jgi:glycosyltransferase involved in cell wall biosynthesis